VARGRTANMLSPQPLGLTIVPLLDSTADVISTIDYSVAQISWNIMENGLSAKGSASATFTKTTLGFCSDHVDLIGTVVGRS